MKPELLQSLIVCKAALASFLLSACTIMPETGTRPAVVGPAPVILPLDELIAVADAGSASSSTVDNLTARAAALQGRADALRQGGTTESAAAP